MANKLTEDEKKSIITRQEFTYSQLKQVLNEYPDYFVFGVHASREVALMATEQPNVEQLGEALAFLCAKDEKLYDFFDGMLAAADKILEEK